MEIEDLLNPDAEPQGQARKSASPLKSLEVDLKFYSESMHEVAMEIIREGISEYPIFVAHQHELRLGELILDRQELNTDWSIHASTVEEFLEKNLIQKEKLSLFKSQYKDPQRFMCIFVVVPEGANFVFYPYSS